MPVETNEQKPGPETKAATPAASSRAASPTPKTSVPTGEKKKEEQVSSKKRPFHLLAQERKLTPARVAVLKSICGWDDSTKISKSELEEAIRKHLKNKE